MNIVYLHGLDSSPTANKATITKNYAKEQGIELTIPDLNCSPDEVLDKVKGLIASDTVLVGSSLGGYFANLISDLTGVPAVLLNPSIRPDVSFQRFLKDKFSGQVLESNTIIYTTTGGWDIVCQDLEWFERHRLMVKNPNKLAVFLSMDDELLNAKLTQDFYADKGVPIYAKATGTHQMVDYNERVIEVINVAQMLIT